MSGNELSEYYINLINKYPIKSIEDPFDQEDWDTYSNFTAKVRNKIQVVGDDLYVTNVKDYRRVLKLMQQILF